MIEQETIETRERVIDRIYKYLPSQETLDSHPTPRPMHLEHQKAINAALPGADYVLDYSYLEGRLIITPPWHDLYLVPKQSPGKDYGQVVFEGMSMEPVVNKEGQIIAANLVLFQPRIARLSRSLAAQRFEPPTSVPELAQGILDLAAILGERVMRTSKGTPSRAYIRPSIPRAFGEFGVPSAAKHRVDSSVAYWNWPYYLPDPERVYHGEGLRVAVFTDEQRLGKIHAKEARNYGHMGVVSRRAKELGQDEALLLGPYRIPPRIPYLAEDINLHRRNAKSLDDVLDVVIADGPGEEVAAITRAGELWIPPMDVNRLGGTTLKYIESYVAPKMGIKTYVRPFSLRNIMQGEIATLIFLGNAARIAPIGAIHVYDADSNSLGSFNLDIDPTARELVERYEQEVSARVEPSHKSLLTPVDLESGKSARKVLDQVYSSWF